MIGWCDTGETRGRGRGSGRTVGSGARRSPARPGTRACGHAQPGTGDPTQNPEGMWGHTAHSLESIDPDSRSCAVRTEGTPCWAVRCEDTGSFDRFISLTPWPVSTPPGQGRHLPFFGLPARPRLVTTSCARVVAGHTRVRDCSPSLASHVNHPTGNAWHPCLASRISTQFSHEETRLKYNGVTIDVVAKTVESHIR